ncbi:MAG: helix-turn-helix domain-containing protein [Maribacter sp.]
MELDFTIFSVLHLVSFLQGILLGILLIVINRRKYRSTFFLGLLVLLFSLARLHPTLLYLNVFEYYPELFRLPFNGYWLVYPLFFVYFYGVSMFADRKTPYWILYPGALAFVINFIIYLQPYQTKLAIDSSAPFKVYLFLGIVYSFYIAFWNIRVLDRHQEEVNNHFSSTKQKELQWARYFLIFSLSAYMIYFIGYYIYPEKLYFKIYFLLVDYATIYYIFFFGLIQRNVLSILSENGLYSQPKPEYQKESPKKEQKNLEKLFQKIDEYMKTSESFIQSELTIVDVAKDLQIHTKQISTAINKIHNQNFNSYVNKFRIEKAISLLREQDHSLSIEGVGYEVGFHSKSAFYAAFKKVTGTTPTKFKTNRAA